MIFQFLPKLSEKISNTNGITYGNFYEAVVELTYPYRYIFKDDRGIVRYFYPADYLVVVKE